MSDDRWCPECGAPAIGSRTRCPICGHQLPAIASPVAEQEALAKSEAIPLESAAETRPPEDTSAESAEAGKQAEAGEQAAPVDEPPHKPRRRFPAFAVGAAIVVLVLGAGTAAALTVPIVSVNADRPLAQMLPGTTVFYVSADLNPAGQTKKNLDRAVHAFTDQPGWSGVQKEFQSGTHTTASTGGCYDKASNQAFQHLTWLGHETAIALVSTDGLDATGTGASQALQRDALLLAPLHMQQTLAQMLSGFHLSLPPSGTSYGGTTIYDERLPSCGNASGGTTVEVYAALEKGYVLLALKPAPIQRVIDTADGKSPRLSSSSAYQQLMNKLPGNRLGSYYLDGSAFGRTGFAKSLSGGSSPVPLTGAVLPSYNKPSAAALTAEPGGFRLSAVAMNASSKPAGGISHGYTSAPVAGVLGAQLPNDVLGLISLQGLAKTIQSGVASYEKSGLLTGTSKTDADALVHDVTDSMSGEVDVVIYRPLKKLNFNISSSDFSVPAALLWQVSDEGAASIGLDDFVSRLKLSNQFTAGTTSGSSYEVSTGGYGYAVRRGWAIASLSIADTLARLNTPVGSPLASSPSFQTAYGSAGGLFTTSASSASSVYYLDLAETRTQVESALLPSLPQSSRTQYQQVVAPLLRPLSIYSGSTGSADSGRFDLSTSFLGIK